LDALNSGSIAVISWPVRREFKISINDLHLDQEYHLIPVRTVLAIRSHVHLYAALQVCHIKLDGAELDDFA
jgi:hypothetical protein